MHHACPPLQGWLPGDEFLSWSPVWLVTELSARTRCGRPQAWAGDQRREDVGLQGSGVTSGIVRVRETLLRWVRCTSLLGLTTTTTALMCFVKIEINLVWMDLFLFPLFVQNAHFHDFNFISFSILMFSSLVLSQLLKLLKVLWILVSFYLWSFLSVLLSIYFMRL